MARDVEHKRSPVLSDTVLPSLSIAFDPLFEIVKILSPHLRIAVLSIEGDTLEVTASAGDEAIPVGTTVTHPALGDFGRSLRSGGSLVVDVCEGAAGEIFDAVGEFGCERLFIATLHTHGDVSECLMIDEARECLELSERESEFLDAAVQQARISIENEELRRAAARRARMLEAIARLSVVFTSVLEVETAAEQVVEYASLLLDLPAFLLVHRSTEDDEFSVMALEGLPVELAHLKVSAAEVASARVISSGKSALRHLGGSPSGSLFEALENEGMRDVVVAPLIVGEDELRGLLIGADRQELNLTDEDRDAIHLLASQATNAIWNAERYEAETVARQDAKRELETTTLLLHAADLLAGSLDRDSVLAGLIDVVVQATGRHRIVVSLYDVATDEIVVQAATAGDTLPPGTRIPVSDLAPGIRTSILERHAVVVDYESGDLADPSRKSAQEENARLAISVPLVVGGSVVGHIWTDEPGERREFRPREIDILEGIAAQAAVAVERAGLYEMEHDIANRLQTAMLTMPQDLPGVEFAHAYRAASEAMLVGGDFYDIFEMDRYRLGMTIGDVAGKGLNAAVFTSLAKNSIRANAAENTSPARILTLTNKVVYKSVPVEAFATVFFAVLDRRDGSLVYANAGHTTSALIHEDGTVSKLSVTGPILGAFDNVIFNQAEARFRPDELLFLYTDGLTEARCDGKFYGEERLFDLLHGLSSNSPRGLVDDVILDVTSFADNSLRDDLAILAVRPRAAQEDC